MSFQPKCLTAALTTIPPTERLEIQSRKNQLSVRQYEAAQTQLQLFYLLLPKLMTTQQSISSRLNVPEHSWPTVLMPLPWCRIPITLHGPATQRQLARTVPRDAEVL